MNKKEILNELLNILKKYLKINIILAKITKKIDYYFVEF